MSRYTTTIRNMCEAYAQSKSYHENNNVSEVIEIGRKSIFNFSYPLFIADHRQTLETKILRHYYMEEIGFETPGLFLFNLETKLNEIMPYYNKLYEVAAVEYNPLFDIDLYTEYEKNGDTNASATSSGTVTGTVETETHSTVDTNGDTTEIHSDTPQGSISGLENGNYMTDARKNTSVNDQESNATGTNTSETTSSASDQSDSHNMEQFKQHMYGHNAGTYGGKIDDYKKAVLNVDMLIIKELETLFFGLW